MIIPLIVMQQPESTGSSTPPPHFAKWKAAIFQDIPGAISFPLKMGTEKKSPITLHHLPSPSHQKNSQLAFFFGPLNQTAIFLEKRTSTRSPRPFSYHHVVANFRGSRCFWSPIRLGPCPNASASPLPCSANTSGWCDFQLIIASTKLLIEIFEKTSPNSWKWVTQKKYTERKHVGKI